MDEQHILAFDYNQQPPLPGKSLIMAAIFFDDLL